ncbi:MAG: fasciclin domain-containing protein [Microthrixaceae bacterium]
MSGRIQPSRNSRGLRLVALAVLLVVALAVSGCGGNDKDKKASKDDKKTETTDKKIKEQVSKKMSTAEVLGVDTQFKKFIELVKTSDLTDTINGDELTLFVPNTEAFDALDQGALDELTKDHQALADYLKQYMVKGTFTINDLVNKNDEELEGLAGNKLKIGVDDKMNVSINGAKIVKVNIATSNATIHVIDGAFAL